MARYLYRFNATAGAREFYDYSCKPIFCIQWYGINGTYAEAVDLVREMFTNTDLSDVDTISGVIGRLRASTRKSINDNPVSLMRSRATASRFDSPAYRDYTRGVAYHQFLSEAQKHLQSNPEGFTSKLQAVRDKLNFRDGTVVLFAGNTQGIEIFEKSANDLLSHLTDELVPMAGLDSIPRPADREGVVIEASVQYNLAFAANDEIGLIYGGKLLPLAEILTDAYLSPIVRGLNGAYGCWAQADRHGLTFVSYRDPSVTETFAAYDGAADFAAGHNLTQEDINRYIISVFSRETIPEGELSGAINHMFNKYLGYPDDYKLNTLREIKAATSKDLTDLSKHLTLAMDKGVRSTAGGEAAILENAGLFESMIYPFALSSQNERTLDSEQNE